MASAGDLEDENMQEEWLKGYANGMGHEIYRTELSSKVIYILILIYIMYIFNIINLLSLKFLFND